MFLKADVTIRSLQLLEIKAVWTKMTQPSHTFMPSRFPLILLLQFCLRTKKWRVDLYPHFIGGEKTSSVTMTNGKYSSQESALKTAWKFLKIAYYASGVEVATVSR